MDKGILDATSKLAMMLDESADDDMGRELEAIESNVQALLKQEWEKSKQEARKGRLVSKSKSVQRSLLLVIFVIAISPS